jgi:hypothetical protein
VAVGLFEHDAPARAAMQALRKLKLEAQSLTQASVADLQPMLVGRGVPDGEARYLAEQVRAGQTLIVVDARADYAAAREVLLRHGGADVQSRGAELARSAGAGVSGGAGARPIDVTGRWEDVSSRYEMLWQQHYGTSDATWEQMTPIYRYAWQIANHPQHRGRPWAEVEEIVRRGWDGPQRWEDVRGPIRDVWEDVAEEAATGAEGGQDRRIARQGTDQSVPARDVMP